MLGFSFKGFHCSDYGICMKSKNRMMMPQPKLFYEEALDMDGSYDFSTVNADKRVHYGNRQISVDCYIVSDDFPDLRETARLAAGWLGFSEGRIVFDDEPAVYYVGRVSNKIDFVQAFKRGFFTLVFECRPFAYSVNGFDITYTDVNQNRNFRFSNAGIPVRPIITVDGAFSNLSISFNENSRLTYNGTADGRLVLNCKTMIATMGSDNVLPRLSGDFPTVKKGINIMSIYADSISADIEIAFDILYL